MERLRFQFRYWLIPDWRPATVEAWRAWPWMEREKKGEIKLDVPDAGKSPDYQSLAAFIDSARGRKTPEPARRSTLVAMLGRKAIYERRIVEWEEVDVQRGAGKKYAGIPQLPRDASPNNNDVERLERLRENQ